MSFIGGDEFAPNESQPRINRRKNHFEYITTINKISSSIHIGDYSYSSGYQLATDLIKNKVPDGIICASDSIAHGVLDCMKDHEISVPNEVQIIGFNDDKFVSKEDISISSMRVHKTHMAMYAIENLLNRISSPSSIHTRTVLPATFIERNSTKKGVSQNSK
ncbi:MAG: substrate-binding domain-containing protein [Erysipelotrichaceae bacterium]